MLIKKHIHIEGQKAVLWYSVFSTALKEMFGDAFATTQDVEAATETADTAVEKCFGK